MKALGWGIVHVGWALAPARTSCLLAAGCLAAAGCGPGGDDVGSTATTLAEPATTTATATATAEPGPAEPAVVVVSLRVEDRVGMAGFADVVRSTLTDERGWQRAGFAFRFDDGEGAPYVVVLAEGPDVDALCEPYDTGGRYSCQLGPVVALNADRWRTATPEWTGDLDTYRQMLVNHEVGHLLGRHHPEAQCPAPGQPAPVMAQQSTELDGCLPNPWPLEWEVACAARHDEPLAPTYEPDARPTCGPGG